ncbi:MAG: DUF4124 domain-containing protein [Burkholderiales bacterium]|nr:DUF4124 domain-containing protein [Burkholderiales bacterium]
MRAERLIAGLIALAAIAGADAALYKWVDDKGQVQYSDKPPADKNKGGVQMSNRGVVVKKLDPGPTPEQQKAKEEELVRRKAEEQQALSQRRLDNALLQSFSNAQEIDMKRDREIQSLDALIANLRGQDRSVSERLNEDRKRGEFYARRKQPMPDSLKDDVARGEGELKVIREEIGRRQQEIVATREKYDTLKKRYIELRQPEQTGALAPAAAATVPPKK